MLVTVVAATTFLVVLVLLFCGITRLHDEPLKIKYNVIGRFRKTGLYRNRNRRGQKKIRWRPDDSRRTCAQQLLPSVTKTIYRSAMWVEQDRNPGGAETQAGLGDQLRNSGASITAQSNLKEEHLVRPPSAIQSICCLVLHQRLRGSGVTKNNGRAPCTTGGMDVPLTKSSQPAHMLYD